MKIALVIPWFGPELHGGAEKVAYQIARRLMDTGHQVEVLTTCCKSFFDPWDVNFHPSGLNDENGLSVRRFPVEKRNATEFDRVVRRLLSIRDHEMKSLEPIIRSEDEKVYWEQQLVCPDLLKYVQEHVSYYDRFLLLPYLFSLVTDVAAIVKEKSVVQPCLHDECYARLRRVQDLILDAGWLVWNSEGERQLAIQRFGSWVQHKSCVIGLGVEKPDEQIYSSPIEAPFILYLGRRLREKGVADLVEAFRVFKQRVPSNLKLVLAGPGEIDGQGVEDVLNLGKVSEADKLGLLQNCSALINPSPQESFSRVLYEAWYQAKPVLVNKQCLATYHAVLGSNGGGFAFDGHIEGIAQGLEEFSKHSIEETKQAGEKGKLWAEETADWDKVIDTLSTVFKTPAPFYEQSAAIVIPDADEKQLAFYQHALRGTHHKITQSGGLELDDQFDAKILISDSSEESKKTWIQMSKEHSVGKVAGLYGDSALRCMQSEVTAEQTPRILVLSDDEIVIASIEKGDFDIFYYKDPRRMSVLFLKSIDVAVVDGRGHHDVSDLQAVGIPIIGFNCTKALDWNVKIDQINDAIHFLLSDAIARENMQEIGYQAALEKTSGAWQNRIRESLAIK